MPSKCCAPECKGNYETGDKVSVFSFPNDEELRKKWVAALKREKTFIPTNNTKVCEKHFSSSDIEREVVYTDDRSGRTLRAPLKRPRLKPNAVPSVLPNCPSYLSKENKTRESAEERRLRIDEDRLSQAIAESLLSNESYMKEISFSTLSEFRDCLNRHPPDSKWITVNDENAVIFITITKEPIPKIQNSVIVNDECLVNIIINDVQVEKIGNFRFPFSLQNINQLHDIFNEIGSSESKSKSPEDVLKFYINLVVEQMNNIKQSGYLNSYGEKLLQFVIEQGQIRVRTSKQMEKR